VGRAAYFARIKLRGKIIRESLATAVWTTAKLKLSRSPRRSLATEIWLVFNPRRISLPRTRKRAK